MNGKPARVLVVGVHSENSIQRFRALPNCILTLAERAQDVRPEDLIGTVEIYRSTIQGARTTRIMRRDEIISDLVYIPVVLNCAVVLLNFLYIAYFLEQKELLSLFF